MYLPAKWGPRTWATTLLGDSATATRCIGLSYARKGSSVDQDERLQKPGYLGILTDLLPCKTTRVYHSLYPYASWSI